MRGLLRRRQAPGLPHRIIPARAGFTARRTSSPSRPRDHPRACGVYGAFRAPSRPSSGSSPRVRGLRSPPKKTPTQARIIPARAGFTVTTNRGDTQTGDHPRACGVYTGENPLDSGQEGSSPRVRGLRTGGPRVYECARIIPARAGFTAPTATPCSAPTDHPRACGVYVAAARVLATTGGSSPRVRGLPRRAAGRPPPSRIIPARAGFTVVVCAPVGVRWDHPRACGVYERGTLESRSETGSSPRVRGLPLNGNWSTHWVGSSPRVRGLLTRGQRR